MKHTQVHKFYTNKEYLLGILGGRFYDVAQSVKTVPSVATNAHTLLYSQNIRK